MGMVGRMGNRKQVTTWVMDTWTQTGRQTAGLVSCSWRVAEATVSSNDSLERDGENVSRYQGIMPVVLGICVSLGHPHSRNMAPHLLGTLAATSTKPELRVHLLATPQFSGAPTAEGPAGSCSASSKLGCQGLEAQSAEQSSHLRRIPDFCAVCIQSSILGVGAHNAEDGASLALRKRGKGKLDVLNKGSGSCHWREHSRTASDKATHIRLAVSLDVGRGMHGAQRPRRG